MPYVVALSGGIASGKSTVTALFSQLGVPIIDADIIARQVVDKHSYALKQIVQRFGPSVLQPSGELDRSKLRQIIFNNLTERNWLNSVLHPIIQQESLRQIKHYQQPYVLWVVPLLIENNLHKLADRVAIINSDPALQLQRLIQRDNIDETLAKNMLSAQLSNQERLAYADDIIENNASMASLQRQVTALHQQYLQFAQRKNNP